MLCKGASFKVYILSMFAITSVGFSSTGQARAESRLQRIFNTPLIVGASVSAGHGTVGPSERASLAFTSPQRVTNVARDGMYGRDLKNISPENLKNYSVIMAIDFMFWDTTLDDATASLQSLHRLVASARAAGVPLVLGDVPQLLPFIQDKNRDLINRAIYSECHVQNGCRILKLDALHKQAEGPGIVIDGQVYHYIELTADGLHLTETASKYLAKLIVALF